MQKGFFQNQAQNCSAFFKKKLGDNGNPIVKLFTETYLSKKVCCFIFHTADAPVQTIYSLCSIQLCQLLAHNLETLHLCQQFKNHYPFLKKGNFFFLEVV